MSEHSRLFLDGNGFRMLDQDGSVVCAAINKIDFSFNGMLSISNTHAGLARISFRESSIGTYVSGMSAIFGLSGIQGEVGSAGPQGIQGEVGSAGPQGIQGEVGPAGSAGATGSAGPQGIQGDTGQQGIQGIQGETGPAGGGGSDIFDDEHWEARDDFTGGNNTTGNIGTMGWTLNNIGAAPVATRVAAVSGRVGVVQISTTATLGQGGSIALGGETASGTPLFSNLSNMSGWSFKFNFRVTGSGGQKFFVGLLNQVNISNPANYVAVRVDTSIPVSGFAFVINKAQVSTVISLADRDSAWHTVIISCTDSGSIGCKFDNLSLVSATGAFPALGLTPAMIIVTLSALSKIAQIDFFAGRVSGLNR